MNKSLLIASTLVYALGCARTGPSGSPGVQGQVGVAGVPGATGAVGATGPSGAGWTVVQLCTSCVPVYPSTFAEVGFCYEGNLYGTYSANGGFSTLLPPGAYTSDGINCSCSFTLEANCVVSHG